MAFIAAAFCRLIAKGVCAASCSGVKMSISHLSLGPIFATSRYRDYFYEVKPQFTTSGRPEYESDPGYSGSRLTLSVTRNFGEFVLAGFARYDTWMGPFSRISRWLRLVITLLSGWCLAGYSVSQKPGWSINSSACTAR
jgi:hypothetical protein